MVPGDAVCSLAATEFTSRALEMIVQSIDCDKLYAGGSPIAPVCHRQQPRVPQAAAPTATGGSPVC